MSHQTGWAAYPAGDDKRKTQAPGRYAVELIGVLGWVFTIVVIAEAMPWPSGRWLRVGWQVAAYLLTAAPILLLHPRVAWGRRAPAWQLVSLAAAVLAAGIAAGAADRLTLSAAVALMLRLSVTAVVEELVFRGWLWQRIADRWTSVSALFVTAAAFAVYHIPSLILGMPAGHHTAAATAIAVLLGLLPMLLFGLLFGALRWASRGLLLPTVLHLVVDLAPIGK